MSYAPFIQDSKAKMHSLIKRCFILAASVVLSCPAGGQGLNQNGSIDEPSKDTHVIGSPDDVWEKVESNGSVIFVKMNAKFVTTERLSGHAYQSADGKVSEGWDSLKKREVNVFDTYIVANLAESDVVGAPKSIMHEVEGDCETRRYTVLGSLYFAGKNRSGAAMQALPPQGLERKLVPNSPFEKAFGMLCEKAALLHDAEKQETLSASSPYDYSSARDRFQSMGLCMACADNVAQWYVKRPASSCAILAKNALSGSSEAVRELKEFPDYCTWKYK